MEECYFSHIKLIIFEVKIFAQKKKKQNRPKEETKKDISVVK